MPKPPPRKPDPEKLGEYVPWTEADLDRMCEITEEDKFAAVAFFNANAGKSAKGLLQAKRTPKGK